MKSKTKSLPRHFPYQHPLFGTEKRPKKSGYWEKSVYYWWWQYLKRNEIYLTTCELKGKRELANLYADFGDVRGNDFKKWWNEGNRGANLFAEPPIEESIRMLKTGETAMDSKEFLTLSIPLYLPKKHIEKRIVEILLVQHKGKRGYQNAKKSKAKYRITGQPNVPALNLGLLVYDYWKEHKDEESLWEIGNKLVANKQNRILPTDPKKSTVDTRVVLASTVSRYIKRVKQSIENTSSGMFP